MQIVPRILNFERCSIVFTVKGDIQRTVDPVSPRTLSVRRAKQIDLRLSVAKRKKPFPLQMNMLLVPVLSSTQKC